MHGHQESPDQKRDQHVQPHVGQDQRHDGDHPEGPQHHAVVDRAAEEGQGLVPEEVEVEPGDEDDEEDDHGDRVPEEAEEEDGEGDHGVVDAEVGEVAADPVGGLAEGHGAGEGGEAEELGPGAARGEEGLARARHEAGGGGGVGERRRRRHRFRRRCFSTEEMKMRKGQDGDGDDDTERRSI